jgi:hypothetical protein
MEKEMSHLYGSMGFKRRRAAGEETKRVNDAIGAITAARSKDTDAGGSCHSVSSDSDQRSPSTSPTLTHSTSGSPARCQVESGETACQKMGGKGNDNGELLVVVDADSSEDSGDNYVGSMTDCKSEEGSYYDEISVYESAYEEESVYEEEIVDDSVYIEEIDVTEYEDFEEEVVEDLEDIEEAYDDETIVEDGDEEEYNEVGSISIDESETETETGGGVIKVVEMVPIRETPARARYDNMLGVGSENDDEEELLLEETAIYGAGEKTFKVAPKYETETEALRDELEEFEISETKTRAREVPRKIPPRVEKPSKTRAQALEENAVSVADLMEEAGLNEGLGESDNREDVLEAISFILKQEQAVRKEILTALEENAVPVADTETEDGGLDESCDREDVLEAISYILKQEQAVRKEILTEEQVQDLMNLPLPELLEVLEHFEVSDNSNTPIRWDLVMEKIDAYDDKEIDPYDVKQELFQVETKVHEPEILDTCYEDEDESEANEGEDETEYAEDEDETEVVPDETEVVLDETEVFLDETEVFLDETEVVLDETEVNEYETEVNEYETDETVVEEEDETEFVEEEDETEVVDDEEVVEEETDENEDDQESETESEDESDEDGGEDGELDLSSSCSGSSSGGSSRFDLSDANLTDAFSGPGFYLNTDGGGGSSGSDTDLTEEGGVAEPKKRESVRSSSTEKRARGRTMNCII